MDRFVATINDLSKCDSSITGSQHNAGISQAENDPVMGQDIVVCTNQGSGTLEAPNDSRKNSPGHFKTMI